MNTVIRSSREIREAIKGFWDGRDEMNLVEFPVALLAERAPKGVYTLKFQDEIHDKTTNQIIQRKVTVAATPEYGLPTAKDEEVLLGLLQLTKITNEFTDPKVLFSRYQLIDLLGWKQEGPSYRRLEKAFDRWKSTSLTYTNAWRDNERKVWTTRRGFGFLDSYEFRDSRSRHKNIAQRDLPFDELHSEFRWNSVLFESVQSGYLKKLDYGLLQQLKSPAAKRLYRYLDKLFYGPRQHRQVFDLRTLCCEHLAMARSRETYHLRKDLLRAAEELEDINFLHPCPEEYRFRKLSRGQYEVTFEKQQTPINRQAEIIVGPTTGHPLQRALIERGVSANVAADIMSSTELTEEQIQEKIEIHDWLIKRQDPRISKSRTGFLVASIRRNYPKPNGFQTRADREANLAIQAEREEAQAEREEHRKAQEREKFETDSQRVLQYLVHLSTDAARVQLEKDAVVATNSLWRNMYHNLKDKGGERYEDLRIMILYEYIFGNTP
jgi:hypothetical protein